MPSQNIHIEKKPVGTTTTSSLYILQRFLSYKDSSNQCRAPEPGFVRYKATNIKFHDQHVHGDENVTAAPLLVFPP
jgi:hypothetical protein